MNSIFNTVVLETLGNVVFLTWLSWPLHWSQLKKTIQTFSTFFSLGLRLQEGYHLSSPNTRLKKSKMSLPCFFVIKFQVQFDNCPNCFIGLGTEWSQLNQVGTVFIQPTFAKASNRGNSFFQDTKKEHFLKGVTRFFGLGEEKKNIVVAGSKKIKHLDFMLHELLLSF